MNAKKPTDVIALFSIAQLVFGIFIVTRIQIPGMDIKCATGYCLTGAFLIIISIGLLKLNNLARLLGLLWAIFFICGFLYTMIKCFFQIDTNAFIFLVVYFPVFLFYIAFLFYFNRPTIKELYREINLQ